MPDDREYAYGTDSTDKHETLAEAHRGGDGIVHIEVVQIDKNPPATPTENP